MENGPFILEDDKPFKFVVNENAWNKEATVIYIDSPAGTGFSQCNLKQGCTFTDESIAEDNLKAILYLMEKKFPELSMNELYLAGESYAGITVPYLVKKIDYYNVKLNVTSKNPESDNILINLKGFILGNPITNFEFDTLPAFVEMTLYHGIIEEELYARLKKECTNREYFMFLSNQVYDIKFECLKEIIEFTNNLGMINKNNLYGKCYFERKPEVYSSPSLNRLFLADGINNEELLSRYYTIQDYAPWAFPLKTI